MGRPVTLPTPPWEEAMPKPPKEKRYGPGNFPRGTPWIKRYWHRGLITDSQYDAAIALMKVLPVTAGGYYAASSHRGRVDGRSATGSEGTIDRGERYRELSKAVPEQYWPYVRWVVVEDKSLMSMAGCSGGANFKRYLGRLKDGLNSFEIYELAYNEH